MGMGDLIVLFFYGFVLGVVVASIVWMIVLSDLEQRKKIDSKKLYRDIELIGSVKYRFTKVNEITEKQLELVSRTDRPSASAAHSRNKNNIVSEIKALEEEKMDIFRSILNDGIDPNLQMIIDGQPQTIKMSEAVAMHENNYATSSIKTESKKPRKNPLKLVANREDNNEFEDPKVP